MLLVWVNNSSKIKEADIGKDYGKEVWSTHHDRLQVSSKSFLVGNGRFKSISDWVLSLGSFKLLPHIVIVKPCIIAIPFNVQVSTLSSPKLHIF